MKYGTKTHLTLLKHLLAVFSFFTAMILTYASPVQAASQTIPMTIRPANANELSSLSTNLLPVVLAQNGSSINTGFTETSQTVHTGRSWAAETQVTLPECVTNITISVTGSHTITHVANSATLTNPGDEPEAGIYFLDSANSPLATTIGSADLAIGGTIIGNFSSFSTTRTILSNGVKLLGYVETRDDVSQGGIQASFTYTNIPQLVVAYDDSACPVTASTVPGVPNTGGHNASWHLFAGAFGLIMILTTSVFLLKRRAQ